MSANNAAFESNHGGLVSLHVLKKNGSSHNDLPTYLQWNTWAMTKKVCQIIHFYSGHSLFCASLFCSKVMEWKAAIKTAFKFLILVIFFCTIYSVWQVHYKINENNACESQYLMKLKCKKIRFKGITFYSRGKKKWLVSQVWSNILWRILICYVFFCCSKNSERLPNLTTLLFRFIKWYVTQRLKNCRYVPRCKTHDKTLTSGIV